MIQSKGINFNTHVLKNFKKYSTNKNARNIDYQYLQQSKIPTLHFQKSLPRLPIPLLQKTCDRYLAAQRPLLTDASYEHVKSQVNNFSKGIGMELDKSLRKTDKQNKHTSYISKMWFDMYLKDRAPLPINYNPFIVFHNDSRIEYNDQLISVKAFLNRKCFIWMLKKAIRIRSVKLLAFYLHLYHGIFLLYP